MALYVNDEGVDKLVNRYVAASGAKNKTEAVRSALRLGLQHLENKQTLAERVADVQKKAQLAGLTSQQFSDKEFMDEMWGDT